MKKQLVPEKVKNALLKFGLTEKEILTYIALLECGASPVQDISRTTGVNRVSTYAALDELISKGLAAPSKRGKKKLYAAESPEYLGKIIGEKRNELDEREKDMKNLILPSLKAIEMTAEKKPVIKFYEGREGIYKIFDDHILNAREVFNCGSYDSVLKISSYETEKKYIEEIKKRKIFFKAILEDTPANSIFREWSRGVMHIKLLPVNRKNPADISVFGNKVALISYENANATLIEDSSIAGSLKMYLEFMWEKLN